MPPAWPSVPQASAAFREWPSRRMPCRAPATTWSHHDRCCNSTGCRSSTRSRFRRLEDLAEKGAHQRPRALVGRGVVGDREAGGLRDGIGARVAEGMHLTRIADELVIEFSGIHRLLERGDFLRLDERIHRAVTDEYPGLVLRRGIRRHRNQATMEADDPRQRRATVGERLHGGSAETVTDRRDASPVNESGAEQLIQRRLRALRHEWLAIELPGE